MTGSIADPIKNPNMIIVSILVKLNANFGINKNRMGNE
jgi:hypothetical protein